MEEHEEEEIKKDVARRISSGGGVGARPQFGSTKPPKFDGTFDLYQVQMQLYLNQRNAWRLVTGGEARHATDAALQLDHDQSRHDGKRCNSAWVTSD